MSESIGKPWIETSVIEILVNHAHELPSPPRLQGRAQIVQFLTFREDSGDGRQPKDRDTVLWAEITDGLAVIPVRIANEATNKIEDQEGRALTYYRRGFFTLKAAVLYEFAPQRITSPNGKIETKFSNLKQLILDVVELHYISGGGPGVPVAVRSVALQTPLAFREWERCLSFGGKTLTSKQSKEKVALESARASRASSRRSNANANKKVPQLPIKAPMQQVTPQPSTENLAAFREWQDAYWGKRAKYRDLNFAFESKEFEVTPEQQLLLDQVIGRINAATASHPYDPINKNGQSSVSSQHNDLPSFRASQVVTSTPLDKNPPPGSPTQSQVDELESSDDPAKDENNDDLEHAPQTRQALDRDSIPTSQGSRVGQRPAKPLSDHSASHGHEEQLDPDDAISERILTGALKDATTSSQSLGGPQRHQPVVLVPDSDPLSQEHRITQMRHSSPWECESVAPEEHRSHSLSPKTPRRSLARGKRHFSPTLSSPPRPVMDTGRDKHADTPPMDRIANSQKPPAGSAHGESQESAAAASLPSPPPEVPNEHIATPQRPDQTLNRRLLPITNDPAILAQASDNVQDKDPQRRPRGTPNESSDTRSRTTQPLKKRRLSQSQSEEPSTVVPQQRSDHSADRRRAFENKRQRLDHSNDPAAATTNAPPEPNLPPPSLGASKGQTKRTKNSGALSNVTESGPTNSNQSALGGVIPHDHEAWSAPSWMTSSRTNRSEAEAPPPLGKSVRFSTGTMYPEDKAQSRRFGLRVVRHPFQKEVWRAPSPDYPPVTASQVADADEDAEPPPQTKPKLEPPTPARHSNTRPSTLPKPDKVAPRRSTILRRSTPRGDSSVPATGPSVKLVTNTTEIAAKRKGNSDVGLREDNGNSKVQERNQKVRPLTAGVPGPSTNDANKQSRPHGNANPVESAPKSVTQKQYLKGFKPSLSVDLDQPHVFTWDMWLKAAREADTFWRHE